MQKILSVLILLGAVMLLLPPAAGAIEGYPGSTWGELRYENPRDSDVDDNVILNGWIEQGIDWTSWGKVKLNTYATIRYKWDSEKLDWNNSIGPGVGIALAAYSSQGDQIKIGVEYIWDRFYESDRTEEKAVVFMKWYGWWDLMKK